MPLIAPVAASMTSPEGSPVALYPSIRSMLRGSTSLGAVNPDFDAVTSTLVSEVAVKVSVPTCTETLTPASGVPLTSTIRSPALVTAPVPCSP